MKNLRSFTLLSLAIVALNSPLLAKKLFWNYSDLNMEAKNLKTELCALVGVNETEWATQKDDLETEYKKECQKATKEEKSKKSLPDKLIRPIYNVLNNPEIKTMLGITRIECDHNNMAIRAIRKDKTPITIARGTRKINSEAATDQFTVLIYPKELFATHADLAEIEATIAHEIIHIVNYDDFEVFCLDNLYNKNKKKCKTPCKKFRRLKGKWERLQEKRADLHSGLLDIKYARASRNNFERNLPKKETLKITSTHPTDRQRLAYMSDLVQTMEQQKIGSVMLLLALLIILTTATIVTRKNRINRRKPL